MKIIKLMLKAFGPYSKEQIIDFQELKTNKMFLIHGQTGSGKTTILDAVTFALYGETSTALRKVKELRSHYSLEKDETQVELIFSVKEISYKIIRKPEQEIAKKNKSGTTKKPGEVKLFRLLNDDEIFVCEGVELVKDHITKIIGFDYNQFKQVIILPQGEFRKFLEAKSSEKEEILNKLFKTEKYAKLETFIFDKNNKLKNETDAIKEQMLQILKKSGKNDIDSLVCNYNENKNNAAVFEAKLNELNEKKESLDREIGKIIEDNKKIEEKERVRQKLNSLENQKKLVDAKKNKLNQARKALPIYEIEKNINKLLTDKQNRENEKIKNEADLTYISGNYSDFNNNFIKLSGEKEVFEGKKKELNELNRVKAKAEEYLSLKKAEKIIADSYNGKKSAFDNLTLKLEDLKERKNCLTLELNNFGDNAGYYLERENERLFYTKIKETIQTKENNEKIKNEINKIESLINKKYDEIKEIRSECNILKNEYEIFFKNYELSTAYNLAKELRDGDKCKVCGSTSHPCPALKPKEFCESKTLELNREKITLLEEKIASITKEIDNKKDNLNGKDGLNTIFETNKNKYSDYYFKEFAELKILLSQSEKRGTEYSDNIKKIEY